jgi:hypothetical protein
VTGDRSGEAGGRGAAVCWFVGFSTENSRRARPFHCPVRPLRPRTNGLKNYIRRSSYSTTDHIVPTVSLAYRGREAEARPIKPAAPIEKNT